MKNLKMFCSTNIRKKSITIPVDVIVIVGVVKTVPEEPEETDVPEVPEVPEETVLEGPIVLTAGL